jgi:hypothetical protein
MKRLNAIKGKGFLWKLTENYLNATMVLVLIALVMHSMIYRDMFFMALTAAWVVIIPFLGTFIDMKSNEKRLKDKRVGFD